VRYRICSFRSLWPAVHIILRPGVVTSELKAFLVSRQILRFQRTNTIVKAYEGSVSYWLGDFTYSFFQLAIPLPYWVTGIYSSVLSVYFRCWPALLQGLWC